MSTPQKTLAIQAALSNNWELAEDINSQLLTENPHDIDSLNRIGFALMKLGKFKKAKEAYKKVLDLDNTNPIALKNIKRVDSVSKEEKNGRGKSVHVLSPVYADIYIEEAGKTKTIELKNLADKKMLSLIEPGDSVFMQIKRSKIFIQSADKKYIGMLPDNISLRLILFIKGGNEYVTCIKACDEKNVTIFIKETKKSNKFRNQASFSSTHHLPEND